MKPSSPPPSRGLAIAVVQNLAPFRDRLAALSDAAVAKLAGVTTDDVAAFRKLTGAPAAAVPTPAKAPAAQAPAAKAVRAPAEEAPAVQGRRQKLDAYRHLMGTMDDAEVARLAGASAKGVWKHRQKYGIPAASRAAASPRATPAAGAVVASAKAKPAAGAVVAPPRSTPAAPPTAPAPTPGGPRRSKLDEHRGIVGVLQDEEVGARAGVTSEAVRQYRVRYGIPSPWRRAPAPTPVAAVRAPPAPRGDIPIPRTGGAGSPPTGTAGPGKRTSKLEAYRNIVGVLPDKVVAERAGIGEEAVRRFRVSLGLKAPGKEPKSVAPSQGPAARTSAPAAGPKPATKTAAAASVVAKPRFRASKLDAHLDIVGVLSDRAVAEKLGMTPDGVRKYRVLRGIAPPPPQRGKRAVAPPTKPVQATPPAVAKVAVAKPAAVAVAKPTAVAVAKPAAVAVAKPAAVAVAKPAAVAVAKPAAVAVAKPAAVAVAKPAAVAVAKPAAVAVAKPAAVAVAKPAAVAVASVPAAAPMVPVHEIDTGLTAYVVTARNGAEERRFFVIGPRLVEALGRAEAALARRTDGPWRVTRVRENGVGLG